MESLLKFALLTTLLLVLYGKVEAKFCGTRIRGSGTLAYPRFIKKFNPPKIFRTGLDKTTDCIVFGKIEWSRNLILNLTNLTANAKISITTFGATRTENGVRQWPAMGEQSIQIEGNASRYFELKFPITGTIFTLLYTRKKARSLNGGVDGETIAVDDRVCGESLHGSGKLSYSGAPIKRELLLQKRRTKCTLRGKVKWTNNLILNFTDVTDSHSIAIELCGAVRPVQLPFDGDHDITLEGNRSKFFTIEFPRRGFNFTLTYTQLKSRPDLRCGPLQRWTQNIAGISCDKREICDSSCAVQCRKGESFWPPLYSYNHGAPLFDEVHAECRPNASGTQVWRFKALTFDRNSKLYSKFEWSEESILITCAKPRCENLPEGVKVISCTDRFYRNSHCTLQCKEGFLPFPELEVTKSNSSYVFRDDVQIPVVQFEVTCREDLEYPNRGKWDTVTSADGQEDEPTLGCINIAHVKDLCMRREVPTSSFVRANDRIFVNCPYSDEQLNDILGQTGALSLLGPILVEPSSNGTTLEQQPTPQTLMSSHVDCTPYCVWEGNAYVQCVNFKTPTGLSDCLRCQNNPEAGGCYSNIIG